MAVVGVDDCATVCKAMLKRSSSRLVLRQHCDAVRMLVGCNNIFRPQLEQGAAHRRLLWVTVRVLRDLLHCLCWQHKNGSVPLAAPARATIILNLKLIVSAAAEEGSEQLLLLYFATAVLKMNRFKMMPQSI